MRHVNNHDRYGFTLVELLVTMAIIALLAVLLVPTFANTREHTRAATCRNNLKELANGINSAPGRRPYPAVWRKFLMDRGVEGVLNCPSDLDADPDAELQDFPDLEDVYLVQKQDGRCRFSNIKMILDHGTAPEDPQVNRRDSAHGVTAGEGQALILVGSECCMMRVTFGSTTRFESLIVPTTHTGHRSIHWLCVDDGRPGWRDYVTAQYDNGQADSDVFPMRLQSGHFYKTKWPDFTIGDQHSSYAMNDAVDSINPRPGQLMLVEWTKDVAKVLEQGFGTDRLGSSNLDEKGCLRTRHFDMANLAMTDGSVRSMTREELQWQRDAYTPVEHKGIWAP